MDQLLGDSAPKRSSHPSEEESASGGHDAARELTCLSQGVAPLHTKNLSLVRDPNGERIQQTASIGGATTSFATGTTPASYTYDGDGLRMSKTTGKTTTQFAWDLAEGLPTILVDGSTSYVTGPSGLPLEQISGSKALSYYQDQLGSTRGILDSRGSTQGTYSYGPYGELQSSSGSVSNSFQYAGQYTDSESGLQYLRARYYDPATVDFLSVDSLVRVTMQPYAYAGDDPVNLSDPTGGCSNLARRREARYWGPVKVGSCTAEITGPGGDSRGRHYSLRIYDAQGHDIRNYHIYYKGKDEKGRMWWQTRVWRRGHYLRTEDYTGRTATDGANKQVRDAAGEMAAEVERSITGVCGKGNNIEALLTRPTGQHPFGPLPGAFYELYSRGSGTDTVDGFCPLPPPFSCE